MRVISKRRLREFWQRWPEARTPLLAWYKTALEADWDSLIAVRQTFPHADAIRLRTGLVVTVFNVGGNKYRLITRIIYPYRRIYVKYVLTHGDYDLDDWKEQLCRE
jgi:mRNA interferase HigB